MSEAILVVLIIVPFLAALACFFIRSTAFRTFVVIGTVCVLAISSLLLQESPAGGFDGVSAGIIDPVIT
ncbi:MAG: hypothetical protein MUO19_04185, partial [Dehalococcoidales bacterium]|nr:hypothetical protein [Dehalococcoidales bacterium]